MHLLELPQIAIIDSDVAFGLRMIKIVQSL